MAKDSARLDRWMRTKKAYGDPCARRGARAHGWILCKLALTLGAILETAATAGMERVLPDFTGHAAGLMSSDPMLRGRGNWFSLQPSCSDLCDAKGNR